MLIHLINFLRLTLNLTKALNTVAYYASMCSLQCCKLYKISNKISNWKSEEEKAVIHIGILK